LVLRLVLRVVVVLVLSRFGMEDFQFIFLVVAATLFVAVTAIASLFVVDFQFLCLLFHPLVVILYVMVRFRFLFLCLLAAVIVIVIVIVTETVTETVVVVAMIQI